MRLPNLRQSTRLEFNMTPMIDVVFLLIIFFLVSSHLAKQELQPDLDLPVADSGEKQVDTAHRRLTLNVLSDGDLTLAGRPVRRQDLPARLLDARQQEPGELEVRIRSDREVPYGRIAPILRSCVRAGIWNVQFGVLRPEDNR
ncbi:MAG: ExbD/TolR family protein [Pirellulaceae bacterium]